MPCKTRTYNFIALIHSVHKSIYNIVMKQRSQWKSIHLDSYRVIFFIHFIGQIKKGFFFFRTPSIYTNICKINCCGEKCFLNFQKYSSLRIISGSVTYVKQYYCINFLLKYGHFNEVQSIIFVKCFTQYSFWIVYFIS